MILKRNGDKLNVISEVEFKITKLGVDLYKYFATSEEIYKNNKFDKFSLKQSKIKKIICKYYQQIIIY